MGSFVDPVPVAVALGSNLGDRSRHLADAADELAELLGGFRLSSVVETEAVGAGEQPPYLNATATGRTTLDPHRLLRKLLSIERAHGRTRPYQWAPRTLDLDLVLYGGQVISTTRLSVPHPRFRERRFVLEPLAEIAGDWKDPVSGFTVRQLLARLG